MSNRLNTSHGGTLRDALLNEALPKPALVLWLNWGNESKALWWRNTINKFCGERSYLRGCFLGTKLLSLLQSSSSTLFPIVLCTKLLVGLYLDSRGSSYQKLKHKVKVWCLCTGIATFWRLYFFRSARNLEKHQNRRHFEVASLLGLEHVSYWKEQSIVSTGGWQKALSTGIA